MYPCVVMTKNARCRASFIYAAALAVIACLTLSAQTPSQTAGTSQSDWSNIHIRNCSIKTVGPTVVQRTDGVTIEFVNTGTKVAKEVTFIVLYRAQPVQIKDDGTFSPGAIVKHSFEDVLYGQTYLGATPELCRVRKVVFADGTVSVPPSSPAALPPPPNQH